jgi:hypothetical protein
VVAGKHGGDAAARPRGGPRPSVSCCRRRPRRPRPR